MEGLERVVDQRTANDDLYLVEFPDLTTIIKPLTLKRAQAYRQLIGNGSDTLLCLELEEAICRECLVESNPEIDLQDPNVVGSTKAGLLGTLARVIMILSLPGSLDEVNFQLQLTRPLAQSPEAQLKLLICGAFGYKPEDLDSWTWNKVVLRAAQAEMLLGGFLRNIKLPITFQKPEAPKNSGKGFNIEAENRKVLAGD